MAAYGDSNDPTVDEPAAAIKVSIFGGLRLWRNGHEAVIGSRRQRIVLAELICAAGKVVRIAALVEALWEQDPPASAMNQVHRIVGQLRRTLEPGLSPHATGTTILASGTGYRIVAGHIQCDLYQLRELTREAKGLALGGDLKSASQFYADALELGQGALFGGLNSRVETRPEFLAVEQERVATAISAADLALDQGVTPQILAGVTAIAASDPLNEPLHARLIKLLDTSGRRAEAFTTFNAVRRRLADELGVDPGTELAATYADLLSSDASNAATLAPASGRPAIPAQLPRTVSGFVHRSDANALLAEELVDTSGTVAITVLGGMAGIGKTALAVQWAHRLAGQFPDGQLFINLRGFDPGGRATHPDEALNALLEGLGQSVVGRTELDTESRSARYRSVLAGRRMIIVLDNARDSEQVRPLLPGSPDCLVIVTSRNRLTSLVAREGARFVPLDRLAPTEARRLLTNRVGPRRLAREPGAVDQIISGCAGLPLALSIVAARISTSPDMTMSHAVSRLFGPGAGLGGLSTGQDRDDVRTVFSWSYEALSSDSAHLFRQLGAHPGPDVALGLVASLAGTDLDGARRLATELADAHLISETSSARFVIHDLLRVYAGELLDAEQERQRAELRVVEHYLLGTRTAYMTFGRPAIADLGELGLQSFAESFSTIMDALDWYVHERSSLSAVIDLAIDRGMFRHATLLVLERRPMSQSLDVRSDSLQQCLRLADRIDSVDRNADLEVGVRAELYRCVGGGFYGATESSLRGDSYYKRALALFEKIGDLAGQANSYRGLSLLASVRNDRQMTLKYTQEAVRLAILSNQADVTALALSSRAEVNMELLRYEEVAVFASEAVEALRAAGLKYAIPLAVSTLARAQLELGHWGEALSEARSALELVKEMPEPVVEFMMLAIAARASLELEQPHLSQQFLDRFQEIEQGRRILIENMGTPTANHIFDMVQDVRTKLEARRDAS